MSTRTKRTTVTKKPKKEKTSRTFQGFIEERSNWYWNNLRKGQAGWAPNVYIANPHLLKLFQGKQIKITIEVVK